MSFELPYTQHLSVPSDVVRGAAFQVPESCSLVPSLNRYRTIITQFLKMCIAYCAMVWYRASFCCWGVPPLESVSLKNQIFCTVIIWNILQSEIWTVQSILFYRTECNLQFWSKLSTWHSQNVINRLSAIDLSSSTMVSSSATNVDTLSSDTPPFA